MTRHGLALRMLALFGVVLLMPGMAPAGQAVAEPLITTPPDWPWWALPLALFIGTSALGVLAVLAGVGGSVLFVPLVSGFVPFMHIDFVRGAGLMVALSGALSAGPRLLRGNLVNLRLALPVSLMASAGAIVGALVGLALPATLVQIFLGCVILMMAVIMTVFKTGDVDPTRPKDRLATWLGISSTYNDPLTGESITWEPRRMLLGLLLFTGVGLMAGMFGLGAGWANVPVLNLVMGVPLRFAVATSYFLLAITDTAAALIYFNRGAVLPIIAIPSVLGIILGARIGSALLVKVKISFIKRVVIIVLILAGLRALLRGFGI